MTTPLMIFPLYIYSSITPTPNPSIPIPYVMITPWMTLQLYTTLYIHSIPCSSMNLSPYSSTSTTLTMPHNQPSMSPIDYHSPLTTLIPSMHTYPSKMPMNPSIPISPSYYSYPLPLSTMTS